MIIWIGSGIFFFIGLSFIVGFLVSAPKYKGPESDHFDGNKFYNLNGIEAKGFAEVFKWAMNRDKKEWKEINNIKFGDPPPDKVEDLRVTFINHATVLIQVNGINILTDPVWSERTSPFEWAGPKRMRPPGIQFSQLPPIDVVLISHNHYDHLDLPTIEKLDQYHQPAFFTPLGIKKLLENKGVSNVAELDWWNEQMVKNEIKIASVPAQHFSGRGMADRDATLWCGYMIMTPSGSIYFAGDTGYGEFFKLIKEKYSPIKLGLLPIGAYQPRWFMSPIHMSPKEAVQVHHEMDIGISIGIHYGTFPLADDGREDPVIDLEKAKKELGIDTFILLKEGEGREF